MASLCFLYVATECVAILGLAFPPQFASWVDAALLFGAPLGWGALAYASFKGATDGELIFALAIGIVGMIGTYVLGPERLAVNLTAVLFLIGLWLLTAMILVLGRSRVRRIRSEMNRGG